jgi:DNA-binding CsgD family transcriptional regulator
MELKNFEFYGTPSGDVMIQEQDKPVVVYEQSFKEFTDTMIDALVDFYPEAFKALSEHYAVSKLNPKYYRFLIAHRFIRCNWFKYDNIQDVDHNGTFRFEFVSCPMRGECKYCNIICQPKFNSNLSDRELAVMRLYYESASPEEIADKLFISPMTVLKHKRNSLAKLGLHSLADFISYASRNKLF